jgi:Uma2 family endonuclease
VLGSAAGLFYNGVMSIGVPPFDVLPGFTPVSTLGPHRAADYFELPEGEPVELIYGRYAVSPAPTTLHQTICALLTEYLLGVARSTGGRAWAGPVDVVLADHSVVQPDLVYVTKAQRGIVHERILGAPALAIEVLSPHHSGRDRRHKLDLYGEFGVAEYWIVDPRERQIDFLINTGNRFEIQPQRDNRYASPRHPELVFEIAAFWAEVDRQLGDEPGDGAGVAAS